MFHLEGISREQAAYIRGFAYTKQENWQQAQQEWQSLSHPGIQKQCEVLNTLIQIQEKRDRLLAMREIEQSIDTENLEAAESASKNFIPKFGHDPLVQANLDEHIIPRLEAAAWEERDWSRIAKAAEQRWIKQQDVTSLHNWVVASYYQQMSDFTQLADLIIAWSTDLANLHLPLSLDSIQRMLLFILEQRQVHPIDFQGNQPNFNLCQVLGREVRNDLEDQTITKIVRRGFHWGDKLLRPVEVITSQQKD